jgi:hypothetical protein
MTILGAIVLAGALVAGMVLAHRHMRDSDAWTNPHWGWWLGISSVVVGTTVGSIGVSCLSGLRRPGGSKGFFDPPEHLLTSFHTIIRVRFGGNLPSPPSFWPPLTP